MNKHFILFVLTLLFIQTNSWSQTPTTTHKFVYEYDAAGNRISRNYIEVTGYQRIANGDSLVIDSTIISKQMPTDLSVSIYPNPNKGIFNLRVNDISESLIVEIIDISGRLIAQSQLFSKENAVDITYAPSGIYMINIRTKSGVIVSKTKIIKQ